MSIYVYVCMYLFIYLIYVFKLSCYSEKDTIAASHTFINGAGFEEELDEENIDDNDEGHPAY